MNTKQQMEMLSAVAQIRRLSAQCCSDMQGRLSDDEHHRAFRVLTAINRISAEILLDQVV